MQMDGDGGSDQRCGEKKKIVYSLDGGGWYLLMHKVGVKSGSRGASLGQGYESGLSTTSPVEGAG